MRNIFNWLFVTIVFFVLTACGGGSGTNPENKIPTAFAGKNQVITIGQSISFDGSLSSDSDGEIASYVWKIDDNILGDSISFTKSDFAVGDFTVELVVTDDRGGQSSDTMNITVLDVPIITQAFIKETLEANQTIISKKVLANDNETIVELSFDLLENNITTDIPIKAIKEHYEKDGLSSDFIIIDLNDKNISNFNVTLSNINKVNKSLKSNRKNRALLTDFQKNCNDVVNRGVYRFTKSESIISLPVNTNICEYISGINFEYDKLSNQYKFSFDFPNNFLIENKFEMAVEYKLNIFDVDPYKIDEHLVLEQDKRYLVRIGFAKDVSGAYSAQFRKVFKSFFSFYITTDLLKQNNDAILVKRTLKDTRAHEDFNEYKYGFNNFTDSQELKLPVILDETITHRIVDFDNVLDITKTTPNEAWNKSNYTSFGKIKYKDRIPLLLIHGWQGSRGLKDPTNLSLWKNCELNYWRNFLSYYLTSETLHEIYHVYLYHYTSFKHVTYNAKKLQELLDDVKYLYPNSDLAKGLLSKDKGLTILAHSMGGLVARALTEEHKYFGSDLDGLNKLIILDTPHHGSVGSVDKFITNVPKDLDTHGAIDLNYDNFDDKYNANILQKDYFDRRHSKSVNSTVFDIFYCSDTLSQCKQKTGNPYLTYLNKNFETNSDTYKNKYILYTAWSVHDKKTTSTVMQMLLGEGLNAKIKNYNPKLNFIDNNVFDYATVLIGHMGYAAGGAESVGSSFLASKNVSNNINPLNNAVLLLTDETLTSQSQTSFKDDNFDIPKLIYQGKDSNNQSMYLPLIMQSKGADHPYKIPYRVFWDYDHGNIFNGSSGDENWDHYISQNNFLSKDPTDTQFNKHRLDYVNAALQLRYPDSLRADLTSTKTNPLKYEPVFLVIEKDLAEAVLKHNLNYTLVQDGSHVTVENIDTSDINIIRYRWEAYKNDNLVKQGEGIETIDGLSFGIYTIKIFALLPNELWIDKESEIELTEVIDNGLKLELLNPDICRYTGYCQIKAGMPNDKKAFSATLLFGDGSTAGMSGGDAGFEDPDAQNDELYSYSSFAHTYTSNGTYSVSFNGSVDGVDMESKSLEIVVEKDTQVSSSKVLKTGQTVSYADFDDGHYQAGEERSYTRVNDIVTDNVTGLQWQDDEAAKTVKKPWVTQDNYDAGNYFDTSGDTAVTYCSNLILDGGGWYLPTIQELLTLPNYSKIDSAIDDIFQNISTSSDIYQSSTTLTSDTRYARHIQFNRGLVSHDFKTTTYYHVRCVRIKK